MVVVIVVVVVVLIAVIVAVDFASVVIAVGGDVKAKRLEQVALIIFNLE